MDNDVYLANLIKSFMQKPVDTRIMERHLRNAKRRARSLGLRSINPFAVDERISGLEERWSIALADDCSEALARRIRALKVMELDGRFRFLPECLHLILSLSKGEPVINFQERLSNVQSNMTSEHPVLVPADRTEQPELWEDIDYASPTSEDDTQRLENLVAGDADTRPMKRLATEMLSRVNEAANQVSDVFSERDGEFPPRLLDEQAGKAQQSPVVWTAENILMRETMYMLCGLSTDIYIRDENGSFDVVNGLNLLDVSPQATFSILQDFAKLGSRVECARVVVEAHQRSPVLRTFQIEVQAHLSNFYDAISVYELDMTSRQMRNKTLISVYHGITKAFQPLELLLDIGLPRTSTHCAAEDACLLDDLVNAVLQQQMIEGNFETIPMQAVVKCFNKCFATFWRPVKAWFLTGVSPGDAGSFIQRCDGGAMPLSRFWRDAYSIDIDYAPSFLHPHLKSILTAGKTTAFLSHISPSSLDSYQETDALGCCPLLIDPRMSRLGLLQDQVDANLRRLCMEDSTDTKRTLMHELREHWHLWDTIRALQQIYLAEHGSVNDTVNVAIFRLLDEKKQWMDRFLLTDIFQQSFREILPIPHTCITISLEFDHRSLNARERSLVKLEAIRIHCALSQPLANIVEAPILSVFQRVAVFSMQIARAKSCLDQHVGSRSRDRSHMMRTGVLQMGLEQRMRWFVNLIHNYLSLDVLSPTVSALWNRLPKLNDVDAAIAELAKFGASLEQGCFLSNNLVSTHQAVVSVLDLCIVLVDMRDNMALNHGQASSVPSKSEQSTDPLYMSAKAHTVDLGKLRELQNTYKQLVVFIHAGVKDGARLTGDSRMELLASDIALEITLLKG